MSEQQDLEAFVAETGNEGAQQEEKEGSPNQQATATDQPTSRFWADLPENWSIAQPDDVYEVNPRYSPDDEEVTYIEMDALDTELPYPKYFGSRIAEDYSGKRFTSGDTVVARITPCTENGKAAFIPEMETHVGIGSTEFAVLSPDESKIHPWFLYYVSKSHPIHDYAVSRMRGSTGRQRVPFDVFRREIDVALPPKLEQRKIAGILNNLDCLIEKSEEIIKNVSDIKQGSLQKFYTEGFNDHDSFVQTVYGEVPCSWETKKIREIANRTGSGGTPNTNNSDYFDGEIPWVKTDDLNGGEVNDTKTNITELGLEESAAKLFPEGTVVFAMYGGSLGQHGRLEMEAAMNQACCGIVANEEIIDPYYLHQQLIYRKDRLTSLSAGTHQQNLTQSTIEKFPVVVPPLAEQQKIVEVLRSIDQRIKKEKEYRDQLKRLKRGLMQDLLSGDVRTKDVDIDVPKEVTKYG